MGIERRCGVRVLSVSKIAALWGVSERSVRNYCTQGRVPGAFLTGKTWNIPVDAQKPARANAVVKERPRAKRALLDRLTEEMQSKTKGGIYHKVQVELTYNSNHIEGSRLSMDQTRLIFKTATVGVEGETLRVDDIVETSNHFRAIDYIIRNADALVTEGMIKELRRILKTGITDASKDWFRVGEYKLLPNEVAGRRTSLPEKVAQDMGCLLREYGSHREHALDDLIDFHVRFERVHPFQDGNGRVGRLILFKECLANGIVPFIISDDMKAFYYRGLSEWDNEKGYLTDTCLAAQDRFKAVLEYFRIPWND